VSLDLLVPGVYAWLQLPSGPGQANAGVVVDGDGLTIVDPLLSAPQWTPLGEAVEALGFPVRRVVLTSSNAEYAGGTARFRTAAIFARAQASAHLDQPVDPTVLRRLYPAHADDIDDEFSTRPVSHVVDDIVQLTPAVVLVPMRGQQEENLVAHVPASEILFAGAMCSFGVTPLAHQGDPAAWIESLDQLVELAPIIVPGHGPIGGEEEVRDLQAYLQACIDADGDAANIGSGPWDTWAGRDHDVINVERAKMLAMGDDGIPPSLLRLLGLD
jgi:glyoxylase-like metal-dependent hydrolase (beta-lactamase superfamily II)